MGVREGIGVVLSILHMVSIAFRSVDLVGVADGLVSCRGVLVLEKPVPRFGAV